MSVRIVALGNEKAGFEDSLQQPDLITTYFGRHAIIRHIEERRLLSFATNITFPAFTEYHAYVFGRVQVLIHDCPNWDLFDNDWYRSRNVVGLADIIVLKYSVNDKTSFQEVKDNYVPMIKRILNQWTVPVIVTAVGTRQNEGPPCSCPLCTSDKGSCVPFYEGIELSKEIGAAYLELHSLNDFYVGKYFGGVLEYFIIQCLKQKSSQKKKKRSSRPHIIPPPTLREPVKLPCLKIEDSRYHHDLLNLYYSSLCTDVVFSSKDGQEVSRAHRVVLCNASHVFMSLFGVEIASDPSELPKKIAHALFTIDQRDTALNSSQALLHNSQPVRVIILDSLLCACYSEVLKFIYTGSNCWDELKSVLWKKLENPEQVKNVMEILKQFFKCNAKAFCPSNFSNQGAKSKEQSQSYCCSLSLFFQNPGLADVVFIVQGTSMYAHKAVLVARCEVMAAMFSGCYAETKACQVPIQGVSKETFLSFLEYLYTDACCTASILQAMALLICAEMYQIHRLQQICESYIVTQLQRMPSRELVSTNLSMVNLYNKAKFHNATRLSTWLLHFIASNYLIFSQKLEFQELSEEEQAFVENHRWPSSSYLQELTEYRHHIHSGRSRCILM
ncbi:rho-related BTB domain-containing protein 3 isoform X2 [Scyliorhinus canicula]|uniref:rho-related BTB domain-containing protein 3 isoform X2 n=1 Tax=Scyliorhinus canicula TaxID=7830 RepID=UPI0018F29D7C|nr:rho-related BTB domain-containing protein 3 isoform X2 [Scyliorhinus canicula]